jgi:hypothetical protein
MPSDDKAGGGYVGEGPNEQVAARYSSVSRAAILERHAQNNPSFIGAGATAQASNSRHQGCQ